MRRATHSMPRRRALVIIAVMVVAGSALFIATGLTYLVQSEVASSAGARDDAQSRAVARSGLLILLGALEEQREAILEGQPFELQNEWIVFEAPGEIGIVRLLPIGPDQDLMVHENGRLDLNTVTASQLAATEMVSTAIADEIIQLRDKRSKAMQSSLELLEIASISPEMFFGPLEEIRVQSPDPNVAREATGEAPLRGLDDLFTVYSFVPMLRRDGEERIVFSEETLEEHEDEVLDRLTGSSRDPLPALREAAKNAADFETEADLLSQLLASGMAVEDVAHVLDYFKVGDGRYRQGRIDINTAPYEALLTLEGITPERAAEIIRLRNSVDPEWRWTPLWLTIVGPFTTIEYGQFAHQVTAGSWQYRVRLQAGLMDPEQESDALRNQIVLEVVVDLSGPRPRIAYLRDITLLETAAAVALGSFEEPEPLDEAMLDESQSETGDSVDSIDGGGSGAQPDAGSGSPRGFGDSGLDFGGSSDSESSASDGNTNGSSGSMPESEMSPPSSGPERIGRWTGGG